MSSSDYALAEFKDLKTLMFYHGREAQRRNGYLICYVLYKNLMYNFPVILYGFYSGFSGQMFYETIFTQTFNLIFTSWPIIVYSTWDQEHPKEIMVKNPQLYKAGINNEYFSTKVFFKWTMIGFIQSAVILLVTMFSIEFVEDIWHGQTTDIWTMGMMVYGAVVFNVNNQLMQDSNSMSWLMLTLTFLSQGAFFLMFFIVNNFE